MSGAFSKQALFRYNMYVSHTMNTRKSKNSLKLKIRLLTATLIALLHIVNCSAGTNTGVAKIVAARACCRDTVRPEKEIANNQLSSRISRRSTDNGLIKTHRILHQSQLRYPRNLLFKNNLAKRLFQSSVRELLGSKHSSVEESKKFDQLRPRYPFKHDNPRNLGMGKRSFRDSIADQLRAETSQETNNVIHPSQQRYEPKEPRNLGIEKRLFQNDEIEQTKDSSRDSNSVIHQSQQRYQLLEQRNLGIKERLFQNNDRELFSADRIIDDNLKVWDPYNGHPLYQRRLSMNVAMAIPSHTAKLRLINQLGDFVTIRGSIVSGSNAKSRDNLLQMESVDRGAVMIKGLASKKYICMDRKTGEVVAKEENKKTMECVFAERHEQNYFLTYQSWLKRNSDQGCWYLAIKKNGRVANGRQSHSSSKSSHFLKL